MIMYILYDVCLCACMYQYVYRNTYTYVARHNLIDIALPKTALPQTLI